MAESVVRSRIDPVVKNEANQILKSMGLTLSDGIRLFLYQVIAQKALPFEIKSPKPNSDQTKVSKDKILQLLHLEKPKIKGAYYALPFNPYGTKKDYDHPHPFRWFNMREDNCVLMGKDFWDHLGGNGTYEALIKVFAVVGKAYKKKIRKEYLHI